MPTRLLDIPHSLQEEEAGCLAASVQMALGYLGIHKTKADLNRLLGLTSIGTPYSNLRRLGQLNVTVTMQAGDETIVRGAIDENQPVIVFVMTGDLPHWLDNTSHAVVLVGYDETTVFLNDPAFDEAPQSVAWNEFMLAWSEQDFMCAFIS